MGGRQGYIIPPTHAHQTPPIPNAALIQFCPWMHISINNLKFFMLSILLLHFIITSLERVK